MRKSTRSAFTLVELIVVITILAILGTIGFMSIKGYTAEAKNAKVTQDLGTITNTINTKMAQGGGIMAFVGDDSARLDTAPQLAGTGAEAGTNYDAGIPNYTALGVKAEEFQAPNGQDYKLGVTTTAGGRMEMAGVVNIDGTNQAVVKGNYKARATTDTGAIAHISGKVITLDPKATNLFKTGDHVDLLDSNDNVVNDEIVIARVDRDGITIKFSDNVDTSAVTIQLNSTETDGLIQSRDGGDEIVVNESTDALPY